MPPAYQPSSFHFDDLMARYCPHSRAATLDAMARAIEARHHLFEEWRLKREQLDQQTKVPALRDAKARAAAPRRRLPVRQVRRAI